MCRAACLVVLGAVYLGSAHSWDIAIGLKDHLLFFTNGTKSDTVNLIAQYPTSLVYDEVHDMMLYVDKQSNNDTICGYNLSSKDNKCFIKKNGRNIHSLAFDPVTEKIFFTDTNERSINFFSLKSGYNKEVYGNLFIKMDYQKIPTDIAVDSCRGYIYWTSPITKRNHDHWERAQFNGSNREVILTRINYETYRLVIDIQTQKIFYFDYCVLCANGYLNSANLNGNKEILLLESKNKFRIISKVLTVSKDYIYFVDSSESFDTVWQLPKNARLDVEPKQISKFYNERILGITANYKIADQIKGIQDCDTLSSLMPVTTVENTAERCNVSACENYCLQGNCSFNDEGRPECSCNAGYTGDRCEVDACHGYCLNNGECTLNEEDEPMCQCVGNHEGSRCETDINDTIATYDSAKRNLTLAYLMSILRKPSSKMYLTVEV